jgi:hypothetical protein
MELKWALSVELLPYTDEDIENDRRLIYGDCYDTLKQRGYFEATEDEKRRIWREISIEKENSALDDMPDIDAAAW